jgi:hypothetical protein
MAEPGKRPSGADVGGPATEPEAGVADWAQRSTERSEDTAIGRASTGDAAGGAADPAIDRGGKGAPGSAPGAAASTQRPASDDRATPRRRAQAGASSGEVGGASGDRKEEDDEDEWRHEPVPPVDESNPLKSLGKSVGDTLTGSGPAAPNPPKR